jgi:hypothetical protein
MVIPTRFIITAGIGALGVGAAGHAGAYSVLDGDGLDGRGLAQGDGLFILQALVGRRRAVNRVDLEPLWQGAAIMQGWPIASQAALMAPLAIPLRRAASWITLLCESLLYRSA